MATNIKINYPANSTQAITCTFASLATDSNLLAGRSSAYVDNTTNLDVDALVSGAVVTGTSPTAGTSIEVWAYAPNSVSSGTPTFPDTLAGTDANKTITSSNVKYTALALVTSIIIDSNSNRSYYIRPTSIASLFGGVLPPYWGIFIVHTTGVNLNSTQTVGLNYERIQGQLV